MTKSENYAGKRVLVLGSYAYPDSFEWHIVDSLKGLGCTAELFHSGKHIAGALGLAEKALHKARGLLIREPERLIERGLLSED